VSTPGRSNEKTLAYAVPSAANATTGSVERSRSPPVAAAELAGPGRAAVEGHVRPGRLGPAVEDASLLAADQYVLVVGRVDRQIHLGLVLADGVLNVRIGVGRDDHRIGG